MQTDSNTVERMQAAERRVARLTLAIMQEAPAVVDHITARIIATKLLHRGIVKMVEQPQPEPPIDGQITLEEALAAA